MTTEIKSFGELVDHVKRLVDQTSVNLYDLLPTEDRAAIAWVRERGGLDAVKERWHGRVSRAHVEHMAERQRERRERMQRHIEHIQRLCRERSERITELNKALAEMRPRLMPEGMEWPRYESGDPVRIGDEFIDHEGLLRKVERIVFTGDEYLLVSKKGTYCLRRYGEPVKRPAFPAADGEPLEVGQTVWTLDNPNFECVVFGFGNGMVHLKSGVDHLLQREPSQLTHQRPVLDADGNRIETGMDVWWVCEGEERGIHAEKLHVEGIDEGGMVECSSYNGGTWVYLDPSELHVKKPVLDADCVPIKVGDTVYDISDGTELVITSNELDGLGHVRASQEKPICANVSISPLRLTHTKPEIDSWERIEEDAKSLCHDIAMYLGDYSPSDFKKSGDSVQERVIETVRRCKTLAERERDE